MIKLFYFMGWVCVLAWFFGVYLDDREMRHEAFVLGSITFLWAAVYELREKIK